jgi:ABC-type amino acid transport substrate-binding protein
MTAAMRKRDILVLVGVVVVALSCTAPVSTSRSGGRTLVVGTNGDSPPYASRSSGSLAGLEIDLAQALGKNLERPIKLVDLPWDELFDALNEGQVDIVMAGVTVTPERENRFTFADPYLSANIAALIRREDVKKFASRDAVCASPIDVAVIGGTTGEGYVRTRCPAVIPRVYRTASDAIFELRTRRIDAFVHDGPVLAWLLSDQAGELELIPTRIADQRLAWMMRRDQRQLRDAASAALAHMRADGTLDQILRRWVPKIERLQPQ